jgi:hypothetical protein
VDALLEQLAPVYCGLAGLVVLLPGPRSRAWGGVGLVLVGLAAAADATAGDAAPGGFVTINELLALGGIAVVAAALLLAFRWQEPGDPPELAAAAASVGSPPVDRWLLGGLLLAALAPLILLLVLGVALALTSAARATLRQRRPAALLVLFPATVCVGIGFGLLLRILGPEGGRVGNLSEGPLSLAAERLLTLLLGGGTLALAGLPPLHRLPWGRNLAPLSAILLFRVMLPGFPAGVLAWQVPAMLLLVASFLWSALVGRWSHAAIAGGLLALWSGNAGALPGSVLVAWGCLVELGTVWKVRQGVTLTQRWRGLTVLPAALAALPALRAGLRAQVLLSVVTAAACIAGLLLKGKRVPGAASAPLY